MARKPRLIVVRAGPRCRPDGRIAAAVIIASGVGAHPGTAAGTHIPAAKGSTAIASRAVDTVMTNSAAIRQGFGSNACQAQEWPLPYVARYGMRFFLGFQRPLMASDFPDRLPSM